jgi:hypothetical protein
MENILVHSTESSDDFQQTTWRFIRTYYLLHAAFLFCLIFCPEDGDNMSSEESDHFRRTTRRYVPVDRSLSDFIVHSISSVNLLLEGGGIMSKNFPPSPSLHRDRQTVGQKITCPAKQKLHATYCVPRRDLWFPWERKPGEGEGGEEEKGF